MGQFLQNLGFWGWLIFPISEISPPSSLNCGGVECCSGSRGKNVSFRVHGVIASVGFTLCSYL